MTYEYGTIRNESLEKYLHTLNELNKVLAEKGMPPWEIVSIIRDRVGLTRQHDFYEIVTKRP